MDTTTYRSPLLDRAGAVAALAPDAGVAAHYGDPLREQRRLSTGEGFVDLSHRDVVRIEGPDRLSWLHSLTSQDLEQLPAHTATTALILSPQGHVEHVMYAVDDGTAVWAHTEPGRAAALVEFLDSMRFFLRVEVSDVSAEYAMVWLPGRAATPYLVRSGADSLDGQEVFVPRGDLDAWTSELAQPAGVWAHEAFRVAAHLPRFGRDTDHRTIPNEVGWLGSAVALEKGCYRGQETVARIYNLGRPPRRLAFLHLDGSVDHLPEDGAAVLQDGREVGRASSSVRHFELGPIALALLRRNTPVEAELAVDGVAAAQEVIVSPEVGVHFRAPR